MRKFLFFLLIGLVVSTVNAAVRPPQDPRGESIASIDFVGAIPCRIDSSTGTNAVLCGSANSRGIVYGVIVTSVAATTFLVLRDSNTANTSSEKAVSVFAETDNEDEGVATTLIHKFPAPIRFTNGISANVSAAPAGEGSFTILYRPMLATE